MLNLTETTRVHHATKAKAEKLASLLAAEYPALSIVAMIDEDTDTVTGWETSHRDAADAEPVLILITKKVPELADIFAACEDLDLDPEAMEAEDEEQRIGGSVVDPAYRQQYREQSSNGQTCGDWLAEWLVAQTHSADNKLSFDDLEHIFSVNGVDLTAKWAVARLSGSRGWQGRYRMNGRQVLEKIVAKRGTVLDVNGDAIVPPTDFLNMLCLRHQKWLAKEARKAEAAEANAEATAGKAA